MGTHAWGQSGGAGGWCSFVASDVNQVIQMSD